LHCVFRYITCKAHVLKRLLRMDPFVPPGAPSLASRRETFFTWRATNQRDLNTNSSLTDSPGLARFSVFVSGAIHGGCLRKLPLLMVCLLMLGSAFAQKNDVALTGGGYLEVTNPLNLGAAWALEGSYARRFASVPALSFSWELPIAGSSGSSIPTISGLNIATSYSSLFITPGVRVRLAPSFFLSPYLAAGIGYGRLNKTLITGVNTSNGTMAFDIGGGLDMKILPHTSLRGEIRDFNSGGLDIPGVPSFLSSTVGGRLNNLFVTAGISIKF